jgi:predicted nucleic acid-binding Zn ribbon protein
VLFPKYKNKCSNKSEKRDRETGSKEQKKEKNTDILLFYSLIL